MRNTYFFVQLMCSGNETHRYIICCSQKDSCNDRDAYSGQIREALLFSIAKSKLIFNE